MSDSIKNWPKLERPREKLLVEGEEKQTDTNLLAIILRTGQGTFKKGVSGKSAQALAHKLLKDFHGLKGLDRATIQDLLSAAGVSYAKAAQIKAAFELGKRVCARKLNAVSIESSSAIADHYRPRFTAKRNEMVIAVFLDGQNKWLGDREIAEGTPTQAMVYARRVIEIALNLSSAAVVIVHNHPSGDSSPSAEDDRITIGLAKACSLVQLVFLDHVVVTESDFFSYSDSGRLSKLIGEEKDI